MMPKYISLYFLRVRNFEGTPGRNQYALVAYLPTGLGVERRAIQHNYGELAHRHGLDQCAFAIDRDDFCVLDGKRVVAPKFGLTATVFERGAYLEFARRARALLLCAHGRFEFWHVNHKAALSTNIRCKVNRKTIGVLQ